MFLRPSVKEISDWIEETYLKITEQENKDPHRSSDDFLQRYVFSDIYEIFFGSIHIELHQWLSKLTERKNNFKEDQFPDWTLARTIHIEKSEQRDITSYWFLDNANP